jgi:NAD(P)-dependent dehydrogenase (short-subunit alcohol dehydrogenase family)
MSARAGEIAVVTGATEGIGRAAAVALAEAGLTVVVSSRRKDAVDATVSALADAGHQAVGLPADVTDPDDVGRLFAQVARLDGTFSTLVNCAGGSFGDGFKRGALADMTEADLSGAFRLNVIGAFTCARAAAPLLSTPHANIVNVSSAAGHRLAPRGMAAYGAAKAALNSLTKSMAAEWAPRIRVNAVAPGYIDTPRTSATRTGERLAAQLDSIALRRLGTPAEVAAAIAHLASPAASWTTGTIYEVNGGPLA